MMTDEIRGNRIGVMSFLASCEASSLKARSCLIAPNSRGPSYCSSVVVNRSPLHAHKERNALKAGPGASALLNGSDLLSSATDDRGRDCFKPDSPLSGRKEGVGGKKKERHALNLTDGAVMRTRYFVNYFDDTLNGLYSHRSSELIDRQAMTFKLVSKKQQRQNGKAAASVRLGKGLLKKLGSMGIH